jgi:Asp-tRNA(Asn)/Glu-tRNA(Gln) amidotransferase B subunit
MEEGELRVDVNVSVRAGGEGGGDGAGGGGGLPTPLDALEDGAWWYVDGERRAGADARLLGCSVGGDVTAGVVGVVGNVVGGEAPPSGVPPLSWYWNFFRCTEAGAVLASGGRPATAAAAAPAGFGPRVEAKNLNTLRGVGACILAEAARQAEVLDGGGAVASETRGWDALRGVSTPLRGKGGTADYRFLPEADVEPLLVPAAVVGRLLRELPPALPVLRAELLLRHGLRADEVEAVVGAPGVARVYLRVLRAAVEAGGGGGGGGDDQALSRACAHWLCTELAGQLRAAAAAGGGGGGPAAEGGAAGGVAAAAAARPRLAANLGRLVWLVHSGAISGRAGKAVLAEMLAASEGEVPPPEGIVQARGLALVRDEATIAALCRAAVADPALADAVGKWR